MKKILFTLLTLLFAVSAFSQGKTYKKKSDIKIAIPGLGSDNKISRTALEKIDTLVLTGANSGDYRVIDLSFSVVENGNYKVHQAIGGELMKTFKLLVKTSSSKKFFIDYIHIMNYKTKEVCTIPDVKMLVTD